MTSTQTPWVAGDFIYRPDRAQRAGLHAATRAAASAGSARWRHWSTRRTRIRGRIRWTGPILVSDRLLLASSRGRGRQRLALHRRGAGHGRARRPGHRAAGGRRRHGLSSSPTTASCSRSGDGVEPAHRRHPRPAQCRQVDPVQPAGRPAAGDRRRHAGRDPRPDRGRLPPRADRVPGDRHGRPRDRARRRAWPAGCAGRRWQGLAEADVGLFVVDARGGITSADQDIAGRAAPAERSRSCCSPTSARAGLAEAQAGRGLGLGPGRADAGLGRARRRHSRPLARHSQPYLTGEPRRRSGCRGRGGAGAAAAARRHRPAQCRQVVAGQPADRRGAAADRPRARPHPRQRHDRGSTGRAARSSWSTRPACAARPRSTAKLEKLSTSATLRALEVRRGRGPGGRRHHAVGAPGPDHRPPGRSRKAGRWSIVLNKWDLIEDPNAAMAEIRHTLDQPAGRRARRALRAALGADRPQRRQAAAGGGGSPRALGQPGADRRRSTAGWPRPWSSIRRRWRRAAGSRSATPPRRTARPPTFILFANKPADALPDSYLRYLAAGLRETFDLAGVPIRFHVRHGENPYADGLSAAARSRRWRRAVRQQQLDQRRRRRGGRRHAPGRSPGKACAAQPRRHRAGIEQVDPHRREPQLGRIGQDQRLQRRLARGVAAPVGAARAGAAVGDEDGAAAPGPRAAAGRGCGSGAGWRRRLTASTRSRVLGSRWLTGVSGAELAGAGDQPVEAAEALEQRAAQRVDQLALGQVERDQRAPRRRCAAEASSSSSSAAAVRATRTSLAPSRGAGRRPRRRPGRARRR